MNFDLTGAGNILKTGSGTATFNRDMSYTGLTTIDSGALETKNLAGSVQVNPQGVFIWHNKRSKLPEICK
ncbi:peptidase S6 IgA endopeptidase [Actinobacillus equuli]|nr:peptidase S6 IgA endopeptidase [Actinobacillus equuli]